MKAYKKHCKGFTIAELVIVIAIIAVLAAIMIPAYSKMIDKATEFKSSKKCTIVFEKYVRLYEEEGEKVPDGMAFCAEGYANIHFNGVLHKLGKLENLTRLDFKGNLKTGNYCRADFVEKTEIIEITITDKDGDSVLIPIESRKMVSGGDEEEPDDGIPDVGIDIPHVGVTESVIGLSASVPGQREKSDEILYFYQTKINGIVHTGYFTCEVSDPAYVLDGVTYSRLHGITNDEFLITIEP